MNKLGLLSGWIIVPFLLFMFMPMGFSRLPLFLFDGGFDSGGKIIGIYGVSVGSYLGDPVVAWWFLTTDVQQLLIGVLYWFFPFIAVFMCFGGVKRPPESGKRIYMAAFFLLSVPLVLLLVDVFFLGQLVVSQVYDFAGFVSGSRIGLWIYVANLVFILMAARLYKEE